MLEQTRSRAGKATAGLTLIITDFGARHNRIEETDADPPLPGAEPERYAVTDSDNVRID